MAMARLAARCAGASGVARWRGVVLAGCATAPPGADFPREASQALTDNGETKLGKLTAQWSAQHGGLSGFRLLPGGHRRLHAARRAWPTRPSGRSTRSTSSCRRRHRATLHQPPARGRRPRRARAPPDRRRQHDRRRRRGLGKLSAHPNIEVRLFNPFRVRTGLQPLRAAELASGGSSACRTACTTS